MIKQISLVALLAVFMQLASSLNHELSCKGVEQYSFTAMQKPDNICHFLFKETGVEKRKPALESYDAIQTCACNLANKGYVWASFSKTLIEKMMVLIHARLQQIGVKEGKKTAGLERLLQMDKEKVRQKLTTLEPGFFPMRGEPDGYQAKAYCIELVRDFGMLGKLFDNLDEFVGNRNLRLQIIEVQPELEDLFTVYTVCNKASFSS